MHRIMVPTGAVVSVVLGTPLGNQQEALDLCQQLLLQPVEASDFAEACALAGPQLEQQVPWVAGFKPENIDLSNPARWLAHMDALHGSQQIVWIGNGAEPVSPSYRPAQP